MKYNKKNTKPFGIIILFLSFTFLTNLSTLHPQNQTTERDKETTFNKDQIPKCPSLNNAIRLVFKLKPRIKTVTNQEIKKEKNKMKESKFPIHIYSTRKIILNAFKKFKIICKSAKRKKWGLLLKSDSSTSESINLAFLGLSLPDEAFLYTFGKKGGKNYIQGPFIKENITNKELWTPVVPGKLIGILIDCPAGNDFEVDEIIMNIGYSPLFGNTVSPGVVPRAPCNLNVACYNNSQWSDQIRSVALISIKGKFSCSGVLLNNVKGDKKPYLLTVAHSGIGQNNAHTVVVYWNFQSTKCAQCPQGIGDGDLRQNQTGAVLRALGNPEAGNDFALLELKKNIPEKFAVYYSGWELASKPFEKAVGIHHPEAYEKAICFFDGEVEIRKRKKVAKPYEAWYIKKWDNGITQNRCSGSGLWNKEGRCVGYLLDTNAKCKRKNKCKSGNGFTWYGMLFKTWSAKVTYGKQLRKLLDPEESGKTFCNGLGSKR